MADVAFPYSCMPSPPARPTTRCNTFLGLSQGDARAVAAHNRVSP